MTTVRSNKRSSRRCRTTKQRTQAKLNKRLPPAKKLSCVFCNAVGHKYRYCKSRETWLNSNFGKSERERLLSVPVADHDIPTYKPTVSELGTLSEFIGKGFKTHSNYSGGMLIVLPTTLRNTSELLKDQLKKPVKPQRQEYKKKSEGVFINFGKKITPTAMDQFMGRSVKASLNKVGFANRDPNTFWRDNFELFDDVSTGDAKNKPFPDYVANYDGTLFHDADNSWSISNLSDTFLRYLKDPTTKMPGINASQLLIGSAQSFTGLHVENLNLASANYLHDGSAKYWIVVPARYAKRLLRLLRKLYPAEFKDCPNYQCHKNCLAMPQVLRAAYPPIPFHCIRQEPGQLVVTYPGAFHMVVNEGYNVAEAINLCMYSEWERYAHTPECICPSQGYAIVREKFDLTICSPSYKLYTVGKVNTNSNDAEHNDSDNSDWASDATEPEFQRQDILANLSNERAASSLFAEQEKQSDETDRKPDSSSIKMDNGKQEGMSLHVVANIKYGAVQSGILLADVQLLADGNSFNDSLVDFCLSAVMRYFPVSLPNPFICSSHFITKLKSNNWKGGTSLVLAAAKGTSNEKRLLDYSNILIPICAHNHWTLAHVENDENSACMTVRVFNSIANDTSQKHIICNLTKFIGNELRIKHNPKTIKLYQPIRTKGVKVPTQLQNSQDCGAFLVYYTVKLLTCGTMEAVERLKCESKSVTDFGSLSRYLIRLLLIQLNGGPLDDNRLYQLDRIATAFIDGSAATLSPAPAAE